MADISNSTDIISVGDITERFEELRDERIELVDATEPLKLYPREDWENEVEDGDTKLSYDEWVEHCRERDADDIEAAKTALEEWDDDNKTEHDELKELLEELCGAGGDEQWEGDWYPGSLIRDSHFEDYAQELAEDIGAIPSDNKWPCTCIDWEQAARELQQDYSSVEYDGITFWYR